MYVCVPCIWSVSHTMVFTLVFQLLQAIKKKWYTAIRWVWNINFNYANLSYNINSTPLGRSRIIYVLIIPWSISWIQEKSIERDTLLCCWNNQLKSYRLETGHQHFVMPLSRSTQYLLLHMMRILIIFHSIVFLSFIFLLVSVTGLQPC